MGFSQIEEDAFPGEGKASFLSRREVPALA